MKKITSLLISCSLALAGAVQAQKPEEPPSPEAKPAEKGKGHTAEARPGAKEAKPAAGVPEIKKAPRAPREEKREESKPPEAPQAEKKPMETPPKPRAAAKVERPEKPEKMPAKPQPAPGATAAADAPAPPATIAPPAVKPPAKGRKETKAATVARATPAPVAPAAPAEARTAPAAEPARQPTARAAAARQPDPQKVREIRAEHATFRAQPKPDQVPTVTFQQSRRIEGSDHWQGRQYEAFRSYRPERHDEQWYRARYERVELVGGGYYYQRDGYWYPAWGYKPSAEYYAYDGPIYAGQRAEPPDRIIADVQAQLQHMEYYKGEVDGLLGPLTREALTGYQTDQGLARTAAIDEPTLSALGMN